MMEDVEGMAKEVGTQSAVWPILQGSHRGFSLDTST